MKKRLIKKQLLFLISIAGIAVFTGCTNADYDFDKVDMTLGIGGERLSLPGNNSISNIVLDDLLNIEGSDIITTTASGDYMFRKEPAAVNPVSVTVQPIRVVSDQSVGKSIDITLPEVIKPYAGKVIKLSDYGVVIETTQTISLQDYEFNVPNEVKSLEYIGLGENGVTLEVNLTIPTAISKFDYVSVELPSILEMTCMNMPEYFDTATNTLRIEPFYLSDKVKIQFNVTRMNIRKDDDNNYAVLENGKLKMHGSINFGFKIAELRVPSESTISIAGEAGFKDLTVTSARGVFDPAINLKEVGVVNITSIPSFLLDEEVVVDLDNPQIRLTVRSTMPLGGTVKALLRSDTYQQGIPLDTPERTIKIKASPDGVTETESKILLCRHNPGVSTSEYQVIEIEELSELITMLKEGMKIEFLVQEVKAAQETGTILLGHEYRLAPSYLFEAPLAFGPNAVIVYHDTFDDWHDDLKDLALAKNAYIHLTATAENKIPANLVLEITPIGTDGKELSGLNVELIKNQVDGAINTAKESPIELKISETTENAVKKLDGIKLRLKAASNEQLRGVTLNKTSQTLTLKNINIEVIGKLIYDAN